MPPKKPERVPLPSDEEMDVSFDKMREVFGFSAKNRGRLLYLKFAVRTGEMGVLHLDPVRADYLFQLLKRFLPNEGENDGSPVNWASENVKCQEGYLPS
jgi:hypothetical protein